MTIRPIDDWPDCFACSISVSMCLTIFFCSSRVASPVSGLPSFCSTSRISLMISPTGPLRSSSSAFFFCLRPVSSSRCSSVSLSLPVSSERSVCPGFCAGLAASVFSPPPAPPRGRSSGDGRLRGLAELLRAARRAPDPCRSDAGRSGFVAAALPSFAPDWPAGACRRPRLRPSASAFGRRSPSCRLAVLLRPASACRRLLAAAVRRIGQLLEQGVERVVLGRGESPGPSASADGRPRARPRRPGSRSCV